MKEPSEDLNDVFNNKMKMAIYYFIALSTFFCTNT